VGFIKIKYKGMIGLVFGEEGKLFFFIRECSDSNIVFVLKAADVARVQHGG